MFNIIRPLIFKFSPEVAHSLAIKALKLNNIPYSKPKDNHILETTFCEKNYLHQLVLLLDLIKMLKYIILCLILDLVLLK